MKYLKINKFIVLIVFFWFNTMCVAQQLHTSFYSTSPYLHNRYEKPTEPTDFGSSKTPKRSPQRPYSGGTLEDFLDWLRINTDGDWPSYVDEDYWEEFLAQYPEYYDQAEQWFISHGQTPPWQTPIGNPSVVLTLFCVIYVSFKAIKHKKQQNVYIEY